MQRRAWKMGIWICGALKGPGSVSVMNTSYGTEVYSRLFLHFNLKRIAAEKTEMWKQSDLTLIYRVLDTVRATKA